MIRITWSRSIRERSAVSMAVSDIILSTIERKGWQTQRAGDGWRAHHPDQGADLFLSFTPSWICLQAPLAVESGATAYRRLLSNNEVMFMAKACLDHHGTPTLQVDLPGSSGVHLIDYALGALARYVDQDAPSESGDRTSRERYFDAPPGIPHEVIAYYLQAVLPRGWGASSKPKGITWPLKYKGQRLFNVYLTITRSWAYFYAPVLPEAVAPDEAVHKTFCEYLLGVNHVLYMAKLGIGQASQVLLMLEVPTQEFDFEMFRLATRLLGTYLDLYGREIQIMAHLPTDRRLMEKLGVR
jgi:hypothetical protein